MNRKSPFSNISLLLPMYLGELEVFSFTILKAFAYTVTSRHVGGGSKLCIGKTYCPLVWAFGLW